VLLAEPVTVPLYGDLWVSDTSKESLLSVWETIVSRTGLDVKPGHRVSDVARDGQGFALSTPRGPFRARKVVLAMGRRGTPRRLEVPGEDRSKVVYDVAEMEAFAGRRLLVVGGGDSAVESAIGLSRQKGTVVTLCYRGEGFQRAKERNVRLLEEAVRAGRVTILLRSRVVEIHDREVHLEADGRPMILPNDDVVVRIGGEPPGPFLARAGVRTVKKIVPLGGQGGTFA
jgi:thioredoxin reductase